MNLYDELASDFAKVLAEFGKEVTLNGAPHVALISEPQADVTLKEGGLDFDTRIVAKLARGAFTELPKIGQAFIYGGTSYTVRTVEHRPPHPIVKLEVTA